MKGNFESSYSRPAHMDNEYTYNTNIKYEERKSEIYSDSEYSSSYDNIPKNSSRKRLRPIENTKTPDGPRDYDTSRLVKDSQPIPNNGPVETTKIST